MIGTPNQPHRFLDAARSRSAPTGSRTKPRLTGASMPRTRSWRLWNCLLAGASAGVGWVCAQSPPKDPDAEPSPALSLEEINVETETVVPEPAPETQASLYDKIWGYTTLYSNDENNVIQELSFVGRFQLDYAMIPAEDFQEWNIRRFRLGAEAVFFHDFTAHIEVELAPQEDSVFTRLTDAYVAWSRSPEFVATLGKQSAPFTMDGSTSSKRLLTIDRSNLANNLWFTQEYFPGIGVAGEPDPWLYHAAVYGTGSANQYLGNYDASLFVVSTIGYDFAEKLDAREAVLAFDFVFNQEDEDDEVTRDFGYVFSLHGSLQKDKWGVRADLAGGLGYGTQSDVWGAMIMPFYNLTDRIQAVTRYTFVKSTAENGVRFARYESEVVSGMGDRYNEFYLGLNYYFYGDKLKIQTGVDYANMRDEADDGGAYNGWGWTTGLRISW